MMQDGFTGLLLAPSATFFTCYNATTYCSSFRTSDNPVRIHGIPIRLHKPPLLPVEYPAE